MQSRYYDPSIYGFINADLFAFLDLDSPVGINLYAYCLNNPINFSDYSGCSAKTPSNNAAMAIVQTICGVIMIDHIDLEFKAMGINLEAVFNLVDGTEFQAIFEELLCEE